MTDLWNRLYGAVKTMADGISGEKGKVYDAYIKNIEDILLKRLTVDSPQNRVILDFYHHRF